MKTPKKILVGFILLLGLTLSLVIGANSWKSGLIVSKIVVVGARVVDVNEIIQLAHVKAGTKMYDLDLMVIQKDVVSHHFLKDAVVERDLPSTLKITVIERTPIAMVNANELLYLDADGVVLPHSISNELFDLPMISNLPPELKVTPGLLIQDPDVAEALSILSTAKLVISSFIQPTAVCRCCLAGVILPESCCGSRPFGTMLFGVRACGICGTSTFDTKTRLSSSGQLMLEP